MIINYPPRFIQMPLLKPVRVQGYYATLYTFIPLQRCVIEPGVDNYNRLQTHDWKESFRSVYSSYAGDGVGLCATAQEPY